ncbi:MAG: beta-galactosidase GalB [bacterium]
MSTNKHCFILVLMFSLHHQSGSAEIKARSTENFCKGWKFHMGDVANGQAPGLDDAKWRLLDLPHDWSIEGEFSKDHPATPSGGALPGGIGWYRKTFAIPESQRERLVFIDFDGVYCNGEVWINGQYLGKRPYGYSSFRYELTPYLKYGSEKNVLAVKVDNSQQPNSRWYSGSGIYRNVWLVTTGNIHLEHWGTFVTTPSVSAQSAQVSIRTKVRNTSPQDQAVRLTTAVFDPSGKRIEVASSEQVVPKQAVFEFSQNLTVNNPGLWSIESPTLYRAVSQVECRGKLSDVYETAFGIRTFTFDLEKGFILNDKPVKIKGVCSHHDLGCLGAALNTRALERQLEILKAMGCNGIRTAHNPPAPELLDLCDKMGFIVMDEAFDMWKKQKIPFDYHLHWDEWHQRDLEDLVLRDRNHPSVFIWSIGNEVREQGDSTASTLVRALAAIVRNLDATRPITAGCDHPWPGNSLIKSGALDLVGINYHHEVFANFPKTFPGQKFIGTETSSALATRGSYDMPSDKIRRWPPRWDLPLLDGNPDYTCSAYDNCSAPWGSTHQETWPIIKKHDFLSGMFIWTGFDYLGEPTPYSWPARSSYFGVIDLAGFPKDSYYLYQSEWTDKPVLHIFPHWNWSTGDTIDVWAYTNYEEVELFVNETSYSAKQKTNDVCQLVWRVPFTAGNLKAIGRARGKQSLTREIKTAGKPERIILEPDRDRIKADGLDLSFITVKVVDAAGTLAPRADNLINFEIIGEGKIIGVDNGYQASHEPFKANYRKAFNGMCLVVLQSSGKAGSISLTASSEGLKSASAGLLAK